MSGVPTSQEHLRAEAGGAVAGRRRAVPARVRTIPIRSLSDPPCWTWRGSGVWIGDGDGYPRGAFFVSTDGVNFEQSNILAPGADRHFRTYVAIKGTPSPNAVPLFVHTSAAPTANSDNPEPYHVGERRIEESIGKWELVDAANL
jgi:hypothetical protein